MCIGVVSVVCRVCMFFVCLRAMCGVCMCVVRVPQAHCTSCR